MPYLRRYAWGRPQILQRLYSRVENFAGRCCLIFMEVFAMFQNPPLVSERSAQSGQQLFGLFVGFRSGNEADVHTANGIDLIVVDLGEDQLLLDAAGIVAAAVERVAVD